MKFVRIGAAVFVAFFSLPLRADPVPLPAIDYQAKAKLVHDGTMVIKHSNGRVRVEMEIPAAPQAIVGIINLKTKKMVMLVPIPGMTTTAIEIDFGNDAAFGQVLGEGRMVGNASVAGERCALWEVAGGESKEKAVACLSADNIPLRTQARIDGKFQTIFEVTEITRTPQNPADFELPAGVRVMKLPKGLKGIPGIPQFN